MNKIRENKKVRKLSVNKNRVIFLDLSNQNEISLTYTLITRRNGVELIIVQFVLS